MTTRIRMRHISHNDLDGYASTILSKTMLSCLPDGFMTLKTSNILPNKLTAEVTEVIEHLDDYDRIVITDLAINSDIVDMIKNCNAPDKFLVFDHHDTVLTDLPKNFMITKTLTRKGTDTPIPTCATELYYNALKYDPVFDIITLFTQGTHNLSYFVDCVRVYDTYEFWKYRNLPDNEKDAVVFDAPRLNTLFHLLEREDFEEYIKYYLSGAIGWMKLTVSTPDYPYFSAILEIENRRNQRYVESAIKRIIKTPFHIRKWKGQQVIKIDHLCGVVFAEKNGPVIGNTACEQNPDIDFCAVVSNNQVSLYTNREDIDVAPIARIFGGGGHKEASGFTISFNSANTLNLNHFIDLLKIAGKQVSYE